MTRREKQAEREAEYWNRQVDKQLTVYNHALGFKTSKYTSQIQFSHRQRLNEWLQQKSRRNCKHDTALLPWQ